MRSAVQALRAYHLKLPGPSLTVTCAASIRSLPLAQALVALLAPFVFPQLHPLEKPLLHTLLPMYQIACNSVGDLIAIAQLLNSIRIALGETRGAHKDLQDLVSELGTLEGLLPVISELVAGSADLHLESKVLEQVQRCGNIISEMLDKIAGYSLPEQDVTTAIDLRERLRRGVLQLRWQFLKQADACEYRAKLERCRGELLVVLSMCVVNIPTDASLTR
jgi:hypothetical protein